VPSLDAIATFDPHQIYHLVEDDQRWIGCTNLDSHVLGFLPLDHTATAIHTFSHRQQEAVSDRIVLWVEDSVAEEEGVGLLRDFERRSQTFSQK
jgi:hypothetical protein